MMTTLPVPAHFDGDHAADWGYRPSQRQLLVDACEWRKRHKVKAATTDRRKVTLLLIDVQKDFCFPPIFDKKSGKQVGGGTLYVGGRSGTGAIDDSRRIAEFIYRNLGVITHVRVTMDTHFPFQIFSPAFWVKDDGRTNPDPFTLVRTEEILSGTYRPNPAVAGFLCNGNLSWLQKQVLHYAKELEKAGKYVLMLWPEHCILGDEGHALVGLVHEARMFHAYTRNIQAEAEIKGGHPLTENYSVLGPEVTTRFDGQPLAEKNARFVKTLLESDYLIIGGQAASHCVAWTIADLLSEIRVQSPEMAEKVYLLKDCTSAVTVPDGKGGFFQDFTPHFDEAMKEWKNGGIHLVESVDDMGTWKGLNL